MASCGVGRFTHAALVWRVLMTVSGLMKHRDRGWAGDLARLHGAWRSCQVTWGPGSCQVTWGPGSCQVTWGPGSCQVTWGLGSCQVTWRPGSCQVTWGPGSCQATWGLEVLIPGVEGLNSRGEGLQLMSRGTPPAVLMESRILEPVRLTSLQGRVEGLDSWDRGS